MIAGTARWYTNYVRPFAYNDYLWLAIWLVVMNGLILLVSYKPLKKVMRGITHDGVVDQASGENYIIAEGE